MAEDRTSTWLKRFVLLLAAFLLCALTVFVWRLSALVQNLNQSVNALSSDVRNVKESAAGLAGELLDPKQLVEEIGGAEATADPVAAREIDYLMSCVGGQGLRYQYGNDNHGAAWVQAKFWAKYRAKSDGIKTAEDFIREVATKTHDNETYYVILPGGTKTELGVFLTESLKEYRGKPPAEAPGAVKE